MSILHQKRGRINKYLAVALSFGLKTPDHRLGKGCLDGSFFVSITAKRSKRIVRLDHQNLGTDSVEFNHVGLAELTAIETDVIGAQSCR